MPVSVRAALETCHLDQQYRTAFEPDPAAGSEIRQRLVYGFARSAHKMRKFFLR